MIITVTLNAAIDNTLSVPHFRLGARHRAVEKHAAAGGKGINVARALKCLGQPVIATGFAGGVAGTRIIEYLTAESVLNDFVRIGAESRTSTVLIDPTTGEQTEINEHGPVVTEAELDLFREKLLYLAPGADICVIAGSMPRGIPGGFLRTVDRRSAQGGRDDCCRCRRRGDESRAEGRAGRRSSERDRDRGPRRTRVQRRRGSCRRAR